MLLKQIPDLQKSWPIQSLAVPVGITAGSLESRAEPRGQPGSQRAREIARCPPGAGLDPAPTSRG